MQNWLKGGFEMDRHGNWRLKPQVADTLERDVTAIVAQTGWTRNISRTAADQTSMGTDIGASISASVSRGGKSPGSAVAGRTAKNAKSESSIGGGLGGSVGFQSSDRGITTETADAAIDIVNYDVREAIAHAERAAARSSTPEATFSNDLSEQILGKEGLRNRYLEQADSDRAVFDITGPLTSFEQRSVLKSGSFTTDIDGSPADGDSSFKKR